MKTYKININAKSLFNPDNGYEWETGTLAYRAICGLFNRIYPWSNGRLSDLLREAESDHKAKIYFKCGFPDDTHGKEWELDDETTMKCPKWLNEFMGEFMVNVKRSIVGWFNATDWTYVKPTHRITFHNQENEDTAMLFRKVGDCFHNLMDYAEFGYITKLNHHYEYRDGVLYADDEPLEDGSYDIETL